MERERGIAPIVAGLVVVTLSILGYVLSSGPAIYLSETGVIDPRVLRVYAPFVWLEDRSEVCRGLLVWWANLWAP
jgi:hypothetical protein